MRAVIQRVRDASVHAEGRETGAIDRGLLIYLGVAVDDNDADLAYVADKVLGLRVFPDATGKMNLAITDLTPSGAERLGLLVISQFTVYGDVRRGRRPSYSDAAAAEGGRLMYERFIGTLRVRHPCVAAGVFGAHMDVRYVNDGPVTILVDSRKLF